MVVGIALCSNDVGFAVGSDFYHAAVFCGPPGALALMLALLPTDRRAIYRVRRRRGRIPPVSRPKAASRRSSPSSAWP